MGVWLVGVWLVGVLVGMVGGWLVSVASGYGRSVVSECG